MITGVQIRCARAALGLSAEELAEKVGIASKTVRRLEAASDVPQTTTATIQKLQSVLEAAGIEFIGTPDDGPGIRIRRPADQG